MPRKPSVRQLLLIFLAILAIVVVATAVWQNRNDLGWLDFSSAALALLFVILGAKMSLVPPQKHQDVWLMIFIALGAATVYVSLSTLGDGKRAERKRDEQTKETLAVLGQLRSGIGTMSQQALRRLIDDALVKQRDSDAAHLPDQSRPANPQRKQQAAPIKVSPSLPPPSQAQSQRSATDGRVAIPDQVKPTDLPLAFVGKTQVDATSKKVGDIYVSVILSQETRYSGKLDEAKINQIVSRLISIPSVHVFFTSSGYAVTRGTLRYSFGPMRTRPGVYYFDQLNESKATQILSGLPTDMGITRTELVNIPQMAASQPRTDFMDASGIDVEVIL